MNPTASGKIRKGLFHTPFWLAPEKDIFHNRAVRFAELARAEHSGWRTYLTLLSAVCEAQQAVCNRNTFPLPRMQNGKTVLPEAAQGDIPDGFTEILNELTDEATKNPVAEGALTKAGIRSFTRQQAEALAERVLKQQAQATVRAAEIWIQAALQIIFTAWASQLSEDDVPPTDNNHRIFCPCCGTEAVGSVVLIKSGFDGFRYMHCPLCNSRWNALRAKCPTCGDAGGMRIQQFDEKDAPEIAPAYTSARAESCESCRTYRKLYRHDKQQYADPIADDLATLGLDIAVGEAGYGRGGANPFLFAEAD